MFTSKFDGPTIDCSSTPQTHMQLLTLNLPKNYGLVTKIITVLNFILYEYFLHSQIPDFFIYDLKTYKNRENFKPQSAFGLQKSGDNLGNKLTLTEDIALIQGFIKWVDAFYGCGKLFFNNYFLISNISTILDW